MPLRFECTFCGKRLKAKEEYAGIRMKCPDCGASLAIPLATGGESAEAPDDVPAHLGKRLLGPDELSRDVGARCPSCKAPLAANAVVCLECGYNRTTGQQLGTVRERYERHWGGSPTLSVRAAILAVVGLFFLWICLWARSEISLGAGVVLAFMLFVLIGIPLFLKTGTFTTAALSRDEQQHLILTITRRVGFRPAPSQTYDLTEYQRVLLDVGPSEDTAFDWAVLVILFICGIVPGLLVWWFLSGDRYTLKLMTKGDQPVPVYWSHNEAEVRDIADAISQLGRLKYG